LLGFDAVLPGAHLPHRPGHALLPPGTSFFLAESAEVLDLPALAPAAPAEPVVHEGATPQAHGAPEAALPEAAPLASAQALQQRVAALTAALKSRTVHSDTPVDNATQELLVLAPGLYLDAVVGSRPSTEPYSEDMRAAERDLRRAEVTVKEAEGLYQRALAMHLAHGEQNNAIVGVLPDPQHKRLMVAVKTPLEPGEDWQLEVDGQVRQQLVIDARQNIIDLSWPELPSWMKPSEGLADRLRLINKKGDVVCSSATLA
jgi:hypothetical protein